MDVNSTQTDWLIQCDMLQDKTCFPGICWLYSYLDYTALLKTIKTRSFTSARILLTGFSWSSKDNGTRRNYRHASGASSKTRTCIHSRTNNRFYSLVWTRSTMQAGSNCEARGKYGN